jgi:sarcosine oxidase, subunit alpha
VTGERELRQFESPDDSYDVDTVVVALGRQPDPELALHALAQNVYAASAGGIVPRRNELCETSTPGVYVAGEAAGVCGVGEAMAEGWLAGLAAAGAAEEAVNAARAELDSTRDVSRKNIVDELRLKVAAF